MTNNGISYSNYPIPSGDLSPRLAPSGRSLTFGPFRLDLAACRLSRDGLEIGLRAQAFRVLAVLARNLGKPVEYKQMMRDAWHGAPVSKHSVAVTIGEVRKALQEYGSWIRYRPRFGFCLEIPQPDNHANEAEIQGFEQQLTDALRASDLARVMAAYAPDGSLLISDPVSPRPSVEAEPYRRKWDYPLATFPKPVQPEWEEWRFSREGNLAYAHGPLQTIAAGERARTMWITHVLRKINGSWLIIHEHVSFPFHPPRQEPSRLDPLDKVPLWSGPSIR